MLINKFPYKNTFVFIIPRFQPNYLLKAYAPLSYIYLAPCLHSENINTILVDDRISKNTHHLLKNLINQNCIYFGFSVITGYQVFRAIKLSKYLKTLNSKVIIIWGGPFPTYEPKLCIENDFIDYIVAGDGEEALPKLIFNLYRNINYPSIKSIYYKNNLSLFKDFSIAKSNLKTNPDPDWSLIKNNAEQYINNGWISITTSRGCPNNCKFCINYNNGWRTKSINQIFHEIDNINRLYTIRGIDFCDDNFGVDYKRLYNICNIFKTKFPKLQFSCDLTITDIDKLNINELHSAGLSRIYVGIESGNEKIRSKLNKKFSNELVKKVLFKLDKYKITTRCSFMIGLPFENKQEVLDTFNMICDITQYGTKNLVESGISFYLPIRGTEVFNEAIKKGYKPPNKLELKHYDWGSSIHRPWIKNISYFESIHKLLFIGTASDDGLNRIKEMIPYNLLIYFLIFIVKIAKYRLKTKNFSFLIEFKILNLILKYFNISLGA